MYQPSIPPSVPPHSGRTALRYGLLAGLVLGIIESGVIVYAARHMYYGSITVLSIPLSLLLWIVCLLVIGALAGKRTSKVNTGTLAGLWAGMAGGILTAVTWFIVLMSAVSQYGYFTYGELLAQYLTVMILLILAALGIGTGLGALGGLIGQSFTPQTIPVVPRYQQNEPVQSARRSDPPQEELLQYQHVDSPQRERQAEE